jgi:ferrous iron transport protein A
MSTLLDCHKGCQARVKKIHADYDLKQRLISFGVMKGAEITVLEHAPKKKDHRDKSWEDEVGTQSSRSTNC